RFGEQGTERINIRADGTLTASKSFADDASKTWRTWLHFVHFPPRQSASTDPYMMQHPLIAQQVDVSTVSARQLDRTDP
ncbi:MAG: hypothetical protein ACYTGL_27860, partial [Planctomycetota bacterium]